MDSQFQLQPPPEAFIEPLLEVREHYAREVARCDRLLKQALDNLHHVEGLLSIWPSSTDATPSASSESNVSPEQHATISANTTQLTAQVSPDITSNATISPTTTKPDNITQLSFDWVETNAQGEQIPNVETEGKQASSANTNQHQPDDSTHTVTSFEDKQSASTNTQQHQSTDSNPSQTSSLPYPNIPMLPEYQNLSRTLAIQKLLQEYVGTVCHIDFIVLKLYGELQPEHFKVVKGRVQSTLTNRKQSNKWFAVPGQPGCYTLDLSLIPTSDSSRTYATGTGDR